MHMAFLQAQVPDPKVITGYKRATFEFQTKDVHPADQMDLHKQTGEMVFIRWRMLPLLRPNCRCP
jgi:hypothetical protein